SSPGENRETNGTIPDTKNLTIWISRSAHVPALNLEKNEPRLAIYPPPGFHAGLDVLCLPARHALRPLAHACVCLLDTSAGDTDSDRHRLSRGARGSTPAEPANTRTCRSD